MRCPATMTRSQRGGVSDSDTTDWTGRHRIVIGARDDHNRRIGGPGGKPAGPWGLAGARRRSKKIPTSPNVRNHTRGTSRRLKLHRVTGIRRQSNSGR